VCRDLDFGGSLSRPKGKPLSILETNTATEFILKYYLSTANSVKGETTVIHFRKIQERYVDTRTLYITKRYNNVYKGHLWQNPR
jgi:hypothetical protein